MYEGNAWHGPSVLEALNGVTASQAAARPVPGAHSIFDLTHHIAAWMGEATSRVEGSTPGSPADGDFPPPGAQVDEAAWSDVRARLERRQSELMDALSSFDPARLERLRGACVDDAEFADGRDGRDVATFLDDSIRYARAAYAVVHTVIDQETL